jgi:hypothetical protein
MSFDEILRDAALGLPYGHPLNGMALPQAADFNALEKMGQQASDKALDDLDRVVRYYEL